MAKTRFLMSEEVVDMDYLAYKVGILSEFGLDDEAKVKRHLSTACANAATETQRRIQIDNAAKKMLNDYYDGDLYFCKAHNGKTAKYCHAMLKREFPAMETLYEDTIVSIVGEDGLAALKRGRLIEACAKVNGRKLYAI